MIIEAFQGKAPDLAPDVFIAPGAVVIGDVTIGERSSVWFNSVIRGDVGSVKIGRRTNIQDLCVLHMTLDRSVLVIGDEVTVGHRVVLHGCTIGDYCLIGIGAVILDNAVIGSGSVVAAGAVVLEETVIPPNSLVTGLPARVKRTLAAGEISPFLRTAQHYCERSTMYKAMFKNV
jgi:carbonic anhydrase/acetyltransferase-like protein (isoleucine patch superfamily)